MLPIPRSFPRWFLFLVPLLLLAIATGPIARALLGSRVRAAAAARGLDARWRTLAVGWGPEVRLRDLVVTRRAGADTVVRAESLALALDPWALLVLRPRVTRAEVAHATVRMGARATAATDTVAETLAPDEEAPPAVASERVRRTGRSLANLLLAPARGLPRLSLSDVTLLRPAREAEDSSAAAGGVRLRWLRISPARRGVRLEAEGVMLGQRPVDFTTDLEYRHDDRLVGGMRFDIPGDRGVERLRVAVQGALTQDGRAGALRIADTTRIAIGTLRFRLGGTVERAGPRFRLDVVADSLTAAQWRESIPVAVLGPLEDLPIRGWYEYRVHLDLDLARPDSVQFEADVTSHGLSLDPARDPFGLLTLDAPFIAHIHLPRDRIVERDLSESNPHFRPLTAIDTLLVHAVVTNEDGGFFRHRGFNVEAVRAAIAQNAKAGAYRRGAGTITMQLMRNLYLGHARTLSRKGQEVVLAWVLEHLTPITKERMLEIYLNIIEWGPDVHGADEAARYYFGHDAGRVTADEALFLATVVPAPSRWRYRFDKTGELRPFARAQMHFIGRKMVGRGWLAPELLHGADSLHIELRGPARDILFPPAEDHADSTPN